MEITTIIFYCFALVLVLAALKVITAKNPVHAALFLVLSFFTAAAIWMLLKAEFLAITLVLVYVGAVMVLFLFVVMMIDIDIEHLRRDFWTYVPLASAVGALIIAEMAIVLVRNFVGTTTPVLPAGSQDPGYSNTAALGLFAGSTYRVCVPGLGNVNDGFKVAFAMTPEKADHLAASLGDAGDVPFSAAVN